MLGFSARIGEELPQRPAAEEMQSLALCECLPADRVGELAESSRLVAMKSGRVPQDWYRDSHVYLYSGQVEISAPNGQRFYLSSVSPPARYPLPPRAPVGVVHPAVFLRVPAEPPSLARRVARLPPVEPEAGEKLARLHAIMAARLAEGSFPLPSMPDLALRLNAAIADPQANNKDIARLIQLDPALATKIMHVVNSAAFRFAREAQSVQQAVTRLGRERIRTLATGFLIRSAFHSRSPQLRKRANALWLRSCQVAAVSFILARVLPTLDPERAMLAGLIHRIGSLPVIGLAQQHPELFTEPALLDQAIRRFHKPLGAHVLERWNLGADMLDVVQYTDNWRHAGHALPDYVDVVLLAQIHARIGRPSSRRLPRIDELPAYRKLELGKLTPRKSIEALETAEQEIADLRRALSSAD
jgi:HD-like signal output (HDOD) protein